MDFHNLYDHGFVRVAAATFPLTLVEPAANAAAVLAEATRLDEEGARLVVFPEMCMVGYSIDDLVLQDTVLDGVQSALADLVAASVDLGPVLVVGAPLRSLNRIYNCAVVIHRGRVLGVVPKVYLPTYREFYEARQIGSGADVTGEIAVAGQDAPFGADLLFSALDLPGFVLAVEICEDMWVPVPPAAEAALAGATVIANLSGSPITVAKAVDRHLLCASSSSRYLAAYLYAAGGEGESSTDLAWDGQTMIYENGTLLADSERFPAGPRAPRVTDVDLGTLVQERLRQGTFDDNRRVHGERTAAYRTVEFALLPPAGDLGLRRPVARFPFVPADPDRLAQDCYEAYNIQVAGLEQRLKAIGQPKVVIGVSGGLDSTHALLVAAQAMDRLGRPRTDILAFTMPGFATSDHTRNNAVALGEALGVTFETLDITPACRALLEGIGHPFADGEPVYDVTFENVQAGMRTDFLFRIANQRGGIVLGTGDLSELALGWCTYGVGDQMSHYNVNGGVPKTLMQHLIRWVIASDLFGDRADAVLTSILNTEITPELVPTVAGKPSRSRPRTRSGPTTCRTSRCSTCCATACRRARSRSWRTTPGRTPRAAPGPRASPPTSASPTTWPRSSAGSRCSAAGSSASPSSSARRCRTARRWSAAARCPRAATGGCRRTPRPGYGSTNWKGTSRDRCGGGRRLRRRPGDRGVGSSRLPLVGEISDGRHRDRRAPCRVLGSSTPRWTHRAAHGRDARPRSTLTCWRSATRSPPCLAAGRVRRRRRDAERRRLPPPACPVSSSLNWMATANFTGPLDVVLRAAAGRPCATCVAPSGGRPGQCFPANSASVAPEFASRRIGWPLLRRLVPGPTPRAWSRRPVRDRCGSTASSGCDARTAGPAGLRPTLSPGGPLVNAESARESLLAAAARAGSRSARGRAWP